MTVEGATIHGHLLHVLARTNRGRSPRSRNSLEEGNILVKTKMFDRKMLWTNERVDNRNVDTMAG